MTGSSLRARWVRGAFHHHTWLTLSRLRLINFLSRRSDRFELAKSRAKARNGDGKNAERRSWMIMHEKRAIFAFPRHQPITSFFSQRS